MWTSRHGPEKGDNNITIQIARNTWETEDRRNRLDLQLFRSFKYFMGLGTTRNIHRGLDLVVQAARHGCLRSRGMVKRLFKLYGHGLDIHDDTLRHWLLQGALHGSLIALQDLEESYPDSEEHHLAQQKAKFSFALKWPGSLNYQEHVRPVVDLADTALINMLTTDTHVPQAEASHLLKTVWIGENRPDTCNGVYTFGGLLHMACLFGFAEAVNPLLDAGVEVNSTNSSRTLLTPLLCALRRGHYKIAKTLIERGADCRPDLGYPAREVDWPSPLHYLVYIQDEHEAMRLAETLVARGADVNWMCPANLLEACELWPLGNSLSVTPLRWAILHDKAQLARKLVQLGARFASASFHDNSAWENETRTRKCLLLEAPCTNCDILLLYFEQLTLYYLPPEFARTPLGLLVSEDDTPHRRLRLGFGDMHQIIKALDLLLTLQPGYEDAVLWSSIRHGHLAITRHLIEGKGWDIETCYLGLSCLHSAILYGHKEVVSFLLERGASPTAVTDCRRLTVLHLLGLVPRDKESDMDILELLLDSNIPIDATESCNGLTALHISVRNRKLHMVQALLDRGANPLIPVTDQIGLLSEGRSGLFKDCGPKQHKIVEDTTILGEVLLQCNQDAYYSLQYAEKLLRILLAHAATTQPSLLYIDRAKTFTILHIIALLPFAHPNRVFRFVLRRFPETSINVTDLNGDTPCIMQVYPGKQTTYAPS
ncbi:hypothetical protein N7474_005094 [Penicillium riverlandense]|uniref:uncharacterized protein n=1 Tax=Penicillium riverlandense TaxID=1903569 RepID=UPI00254820B6|nr:uncharacterized protein N7474_005094 [Penicillium riverlandense]KAJ5819503.1 hypothetical protein N7474_005094 [Penicillium riverlandense]